MRFSSSFTALCSALLAVLLVACGPSGAEVRPAEGAAVVPTAGTEAKATEPHGDETQAEIGGASTVEPATATATEGRALFLGLCAGCHGTNGKADTRAKMAIFPPPRDLTRGEYRFRSTMTGALPTRADMRRTLRDGLPATVMPAWGEQLTEAEIHAIVLFLETLSPRFAEEPRSADDVIADAAQLEPPPVTPEALARGKIMYEKNKCGDCHGPQGRGDGPSAPTHKNSDGTRSHVFDFTYGVYKGGTSPAAVYRTFTTGLNGTPMPAYDKTIPDEADRWALVHYVLALGRARGAWYYLSERPTWLEPMADRPPPVLEPVAP